MKQSVRIWHKDGVVKDTNIRIYRNGKLADTNGEYEDLFIEDDKDINKDVSQRRNNQHKHMKSLTNTQKNIVAIIVMITFPIWIIPVAIGMFFYMSFLLTKRTLFEPAHNDCYWRWEKYQKEIRIDELTNNK